MLEKRDVKADIRNPLRCLIQLKKDAYALKLCYTEAKILGLKGQKSSCKRTCIGFLNF